MTKCDIRAELHLNTAQTHRSECAGSSADAMFCHVLCYLAEIIPAVIIQHGVGAHTY